MQPTQANRPLTARVAERIGVLRWKLWKKAVMPRKPALRRPADTPRLTRIYAWRQSKAPAGRARPQTIVAAVAIFSLLLPGILTPPPAHAQLDVAAGSLIRGQTFSAVYYLGADGLRYVFPSEKTYFTWYANFNDVQWLTDAELGKIQIGGNVTYKPGAKLVKINSDPKTYAVGQNGELRWVTSEEIAVSLYGSTWNTTKTDDIPDAFFSNYTVGEPIMGADEYSVTEELVNATSINDDKELTSYSTVVITDDGVDGDSGSETTINEGETVLFVNSGTTAHTATADDGSWGTGTLNPGDFYVRRFNDQGVYDFYDSYDDSITGSIVVE
ncbi:hypothetical protein HYS28_03200 [Candidatus Uhrbacteria bacterium]|nr:hypothetical protein [Candidatus Uhrbacteria bacterium]